jgi:hypothetical protein
MILRCVNTGKNEVYSHESRKILDIKGKAQVHSGVRQSDSSKNHFDCDDVSSGCGAYAIDTITSKPIGAPFYGVYHMENCIADCSHGQIGTLTSNSAWCLR